MIAPTVSVIPRRLCPVHWRTPEGGALVREEDAAAFVVNAAVTLTLSGKNPVITAANERRLFWLGALMLDAFGIGGRETTEENDG